MRRAAAADRSTLAHGARIRGGAAGGGRGAALVGWFVLRSQGVYAAMLTLAFAQILWSTATQWIALTGGDNGILGVWPPAWLAGKAVYFVFTLLVIGRACLWLLRRAALAPFGYALRAARDAPARAAALRHRGDARAMAGVLRRRTVRGPCRRAQRVPQRRVFPNVTSIAHRSTRWSWCCSAAC